MLDQKKSRAFHIHSNMSRHEMPEQLKKNQVSHSKLKKVTSPKIEKCRTKKNRAFRIHSNKSRHKMPKQLKKHFLISQKYEKIASSKIEKCRAKKKWGIPHPLKNELTRNAQTVEKIKYPTQNYKKNNKSQN